MSRTRGARLRVSQRRARPVRRFVVTEYPSSWTVRRSAVFVIAALLAAPRLALADTGGGALGAAGGSAGALADALARGAAFAVLAAFVGGLLVSLTPCVYPMIAITVSVFGANQAKSRVHAAGLSSVFVLGIAVMFTAPGVGAALSGAIFGRL